MAMLVVQVLSAGTGAPNIVHQASFHRRGRTTTRASIVAKTVRVTTMRAVPVILLPIVCCASRA
jgi:hypothetical protein